MLTLAGQQVSTLEIVAALTGLLSVWLARRMHIGTWPAGIVSVSCLAGVFFEAKLYADSVLQVAFAALSVYGWREWRRDPLAQDVLPVTHIRLREWLVLGLLGAAATALVALFLISRTDSPAPWPDAAILAFSLLATWAQARRRLECWAIWIGVDLVAVPLYASRGLPLTAALYLAYMMLCIAAWLQWEKRLSRASGS